MKRKKYTNGTGNRGITDYMPSPTEVLSEDNINKAKAKADAANNPWAMGIQILNSLAGSYASNGNMVNLDAQNTDFGQFATKNFANGTGPAGIEAEGGEILQPPGGVPVELEGPSHENGGVDLSVPKGTLIFSDRLKVGGKTMAERKELRDNKRKKLESLVSDNKVDIALRNAKERTGQILDAEEQQDLMIQQMAEMYDGAREYAGGTGPGGVGNLGDIIGIGGDIISTFGPLMNTLDSRATDTPNINAFEGFGVDALNANSEAQTHIQDQRDNANRKITTNANTSKRAARNSARGVNTQRALDLAIDSEVNNAQINTNDAFSKQMMELLGQKASIELQQDATVMQGEQARDVADRQDKDNFYTQKGKDISTLGTGIQQIGKDVNNTKEQKMLMKMLNQMSKYFKFDSKGNIIDVNQTTTE